MRQGFAIAALLILALFIGYKVAYPSFVVHVRLTIVVDDHGVQKSASSVVEESENAFPTFGGLIDNGFETSARGEAVFLDLGGGNNLFALLGFGGGSQDDIITITQNTFFNGSTYTDADYGTMSYGRRIVAENLGKPRVLSTSNMPILAHFRDINDRKTIEAVIPDKMSETCGTGLKLLRATL